MANIEALLKAEISRISRREIHKEFAALKLVMHKKASVAAVAALKRQVDILGNKTGRLAQHAHAQVTNGSGAATSSQDQGDRPVRFVAKGLVSLRKRLRLSVAQMAKLIGVSEQSIYNWEAKKSTPQRAQFVTIIGLRGISKREAHERLAEIAPKGPTKNKATNRGKEKKATS